MRRVLAAAALAAIHPLPEIQYPATLIGAAMVALLWFTLSATGIATKSAAARA